jgi:GTP-binding protein EngB required for normal cell division
MDNISVEELNSIRNTMRNHLDSIFQTEKNIDRIPIIIELFNFLQQPNCIHFIKSKNLTKNVILGKCDEFSNINMRNVPDEMKQELLITCASLKNMLQSVDIVPML